jgi:hypothetical protein
LRISEELMYLGPNEYTRHIWGPMNTPALIWISEELMYLGPNE